jgi:hypothetical protein
LFPWLHRSLVWPKKLTGRVHDLKIELDRPGERPPSHPEINVFYSGRREGKLPMPNNVDSPLGEYSSI